MKLNCNIIDGMYLKRMRLLFVIGDAFCLCSVWETLTGTELIEKNTSQTGKCCCCRSLAVKGL